MKIVQSYWSKPYEASTIDDRMGGWCHKLFHYMSCALSCLKLSEYYPVELITDRKGKDILINRIGLPYQSVQENLENIDYPADIWAAGKIIAYISQTEPFLHVDNDIYIWSKFPEAITTSGLVVQSIEENYTHNRLYTEDIINNFDYVPKAILDLKNNNHNINCINAGIIGGNNISFITSVPLKLGRIKN